MQRPNTTAIKTTANILLLLENADKILFGIAWIIINNGLFELTTPSCAVTFWTLAVNNPKFFIINPIAPANVNAKTEVDKNPNIVLYEIRPSFLVSLILHIANAIDVNTIGTITNWSEFTNNCPII